MKEVRFLSKGEVQELKKLLERTYGVSGDFLEKKLILGGGAKKRIWVASPDVAKVDLSAFRVVSVGLYVGRIDRGKLKLSIEGAQMVGPKATKNVVELDEKSLEDYLRGASVQPKRTIDCEEGSYVILKCGDDYAGGGMFKNGRVINNLPKGRLLP